MNQILRTLASVLDYPLVSITNQQAKDSSWQRIPTNVYQTWESNSFGRRHFSSMMKFRKMNFDLNFFLYTKSDRDAYMRDVWGSRLISQIYFRARFGALQADIFRYCILFDRGGYYFDISKGVNSRITSLHSPGAEGIISFENNVAPSTFKGSGLMYPSNLVLQWGFGFIKGHELLNKQIERIEENATHYSNRTFENPKQAILEFTGPIAFTESVRSYVTTRACSQLEQLGLDFYGLGIFSLRGSAARYRKHPSYASARNEKILN